MHGHLPTAARLVMWGGDKDGSVECACGATLEWNDGKVAHLQNHTFACGCAEERTARKRWAKAVRSLAQSAVTHGRAGEVADAVAACWGIDDNGDIGTAVGDEQRGWTPTCFMWHIAGTTVFDENVTRASRQTTSLVATKDMSKDTYALRVAKSPTTRTGTDWIAYRTRWTPHFASCTGCAR